MESQLTKDSSPKEVRIAWVAALRSKTYTQGKERLRIRDEYCCLGVLCDLAVKAGVIGPPINTDHEIEVFVYGADRCTLPWQVQEWAALTSPNGAYGMRQGLAQDNDNGKTFEDIANTILRRQPDLFYGLYEKEDE